MDATYSESGDSSEMLWEVVERGVRSEHRGSGRRWRWCEGPRRA